MMWVPVAIGAAEIVAGVAFYKNAAGIARENRDTLLDNEQKRRFEGSLPSSQLPWSLFGWNTGFYAVGWQLGGIVLSLMGALFIYGGISGVTAR